jgi:hypothetical protein
VSCPNSAVEHTKQSLLDSSRKFLIWDQRIEPLDSGLKIAGMTEKGRMMRVLERLPE